MPSRNIIKEYVPEAFYHVYNRGVEKRTIFIDDSDYVVFIGLMKKYLVGSSEDLISKNRHAHKIFGEELELLSYCLMPNHFHLLFYQHNEQAITNFLRRVLTGYVMYFNAKYDRVGSLFQGRYKASQINADAYLLHISRYIHLNPNDFEEWPYSSWKYYKNSKNTSWLSKRKLLTQFSDITEYLEFVRDYQESEKENDILQWQLANNVND